jgi:hypothetical protein
LETELKEIRAAQKIPAAPLAYGWFDEGWPVAKLGEEDRAPLPHGAPRATQGFIWCYGENPTPHRAPDDYATQMFIAEYRSILDSHERREFLRQLVSHDVCMKPELLDVIYTDEDPFVRAWAAGHLHSYSKDYEPALLQDRNL